MMSQTEDHIVRAEPEGDGGADGELRSRFES
jgi:hypothetical protein